MNKLKALVLLSSVLLLGCKSEETSFADFANNIQKKEATTARSSNVYMDDVSAFGMGALAENLSGEMQLGEKVLNPYSVEVMRRASTMLHTEYSQLPLKDIKPNAVYIRLLPKDSAEYRFLTEKLKLELFDYPLDRKIIRNGEYYRDRETIRLPFPWLYTTIETDKFLGEITNINILFQDITHEILDICYIPPTSNELDDSLSEQAPKSVTEVLNAAALSTSSQAYDELLEIKALQLAETIPSEYAAVPAAELLFFWKRYRPKGKVQVWDTELKKHVPLKGIKVRVNVVVKWSSTYTDAYGNYQIPARFAIGPFYTFIFENRKDFKIYKGVNLFLVSRYMSGFHSKKGHDKNFDDESWFYWRDATINNVTYDYYEMCQREGIALPVRGLKIWQWSAFSSSSAPMIRRIWNFIGYNDHGRLNSFIINMGYGIPLTIISHVTKSLQPDIIIGKCGNGTSPEFYNTVSHELAHASHFSQVGSNYWADYISYILTYGAYGDGTGKNAGICAVGEMWGYAIGNIREKEQYGFTNIRDKGLKYWFKPHGLTSLLDDKLLSKKQVFSTLNPYVKSREEFRVKLIHYYPSNKNKINEYFNKKKHS